MSQTRRTRPEPKPASEAPRGRRFGRPIAPERIEKVNEAARRLQGIANEAVADYSPGAARPSTKQSRQAEREVVVTLRLPRELHARLKELGGERGLTAQIRARLEASFLPGTGEADAKTREALDAIAWILTGYAPSKGSQWHSDPRGFFVARTAVQAILDHFKPKDEFEPDDIERAREEGRGSVLATVALARARGEL